ncbi:MAG: hypothetical protein MN733_40560, partial [Nitrososphaera sp.]|nr:hypothetical protein [Nitrososphaera sp.]
MSTGNLVISVSSYYEKTFVLESIHKNRKKFQGSVIGPLKIIQENCGRALMSYSNKSSTERLYQGLVIRWLRGYTQL